MHNAETNVIKKKTTNHLFLPNGYRDVAKLQQRLKEPENNWTRRGERRALKLFHSMSQRVPAYKDFLKSQKFSPHQVRTHNDFLRVPLINKDNYLRRYPKNMLCWDGNFAEDQWVISTTSGSTGQPFYFPRQQSQDWQYAVMAELYLRNNFNIQENNTLYIVAFPMGAWIGGLFTYEALKLVAKKGGYNLSIITPGINKQEVINAIKQLGSQFDQIIIGAYAPFLKDIIDDGQRDGIKWPELNLGFIFSAEAFSETFRDYILKTTGSENELTSTLNHYGTVDLGTMAHETPESILIRRLLIKNNALNTLFPETYRQPTFAQYNPELFYFEELDQSLICSAYSGLPLVRYELKDYGGVLGRNIVHHKLESNGINLEEAITEAGISDVCCNLPFVYVYERNDFSVSYYAFLIYPDMVRRSLQTKDLLQSLTGKFTITVDYASNGRQILNLHVELREGKTESQQLIDSIRDKVHLGLLDESSEYRETANTIGESIKPVVRLWPYENNKYFKSGTKQKWVIK